MSTSSHVTYHARAEGERDTLHMCKWDNLAFLEVCLSSGLCIFSVPNCSKAWSVQ